METKDRERPAEKLAKMTVQQLAKHLEDATRAEMLRQLDLIPEVVRSIINENAEAIILAHLGVRKSTWDGWEADHCNGRRTALADDMGREAIAAIKAALPDFISDLAAGSATAKGIRAAAKREFQEQFGFALGREVESHAKEAAKAKARALVSLAAEETGKRP